MKKQYKRDVGLSINLFWGVLVLAVAIIISYIIQDAYQDGYKKGIEMSNMCHENKYPEATKGCLDIVKSSAMDFYKEGK